MLRLTLPHPINDDSKTTRLVEGAGGVGSEKVHSGSGIQRVTDTQQRTTDTATPLPRVYGHLGDVYSDRSIGETPHKSDNLVAFHSHQRRPGMLPG